MKRKFLIILLLLLSVVCCAVALSACGGCNPNNSNTNENGQGESNNGQSGSEDSDDYDPTYYTVGLEFRPRTEDYEVVGYEVSLGDARNNAIVIPEIYKNKPVQSIGYGAFSEYTDLVSVTIPSSVTSIQRDAFSGCKNLKDVKFLNNSQLKDVGEYAFENCSSLKSISIPEGCTLIDSSAFECCENLTNITLPSSVTSIGLWAFAGTGYYLNSENWDNGVLYIGDCLIIADNSKIPSDYAIKQGTRVIADFAFSDDVKRLNKITIPDTLAFMGHSAFSGCTNLTGVYINDVWAWCNINIDDTQWSIDKTNPLSYAHNLYLNNALVTNLIIPNGVENIERRIFWGCTSIRSVSIPDSVTSIEKEAFWDCENLSNITIGKNVTSMGVNAFAGTASAASYESGSSDDWYIGDYLIRGSVSSTDYVVKTGTITIADEAFRARENLENVVIPSSVISIGDSAFYDCYELKSITIPNSVKIIHSNAFFDCDKLEKVYISDLASWCNIEFNGGLFQSTSNPLYYAHNLYINNQLVTSLEIPNGVKEIKDYAFAGCTCITNIVIPEEVTSIGYRAFYGCDNINNITVPNSVMEIDENAFEDCTGLKSVNIGKSVKSLGNYVFEGCLNLENIDVEASNANYSSVNGILYNKDKTTLIRIPQNKADVVLAESITAIEREAAYGYRGSDSIHIPNSVATIGNCAFYDCSAEIVWGDNPVIIKFDEYAFYHYKGTKIVIPTDITQIGYYAFGYCWNLREVYISDIAKWCSIEFDYGPTRYEGVLSANPLNYAGKLYLNDELITELDIPQEVTQIDDFTFYGLSNITDITIPTSVTYIGKDAFSECSNLKSVKVTDDNLAYSSQAGILYDKNKTEIICMPKRIEGHIVIPYTVTSIADYLFKDSIKITDIEFEDNSQCVSIGGGAFQDCTGLVNVKFGKNCQLVTIGDLAFSGCIGLKSINIPDSVETIGRSAFSVEYGYSYCDQLEEVLLSENSKLNSIGDYAFKGCSSLENFFMPATLQKIGDYAFSGCTAIITWDENSTITELVSWEFSGYKGSTLALPHSLTKLAQHVFHNCTNLEEIVIPANVTYVYAVVFYNCPKLKSITFENPEGWIRTDELSNPERLSIDFSNPSDNVGIFRNAERLLNTYFKREQTYPTNFS